MILHNALCRRGILREQCCRPYWSPDQVAAAVRTDTAELRSSTFAAEGAFERAYSRIRRIHQKIAVTAFTIWAYLQHVYRRDSLYGVVIKMLLKMLLKCAKYPAQCSLFAS